MEDERSLQWRWLLHSQAGVISWEQARNAGFTRQAIEWQLGSGTWQRLHRGAYATFTGDLSREARLWAVVLRVGPGRPGQHRKIPGVVIHRSRGLVAQRQPPWQLPRTSVEDTVLDLIAAARSFDDAYGWIAAAVGRRLTTAGLLGQALATRSRMRWRGWITAALHDAADGIHSPLERRYVHGVERAHGPPAAHPPEGRWRDTRRDNANQLQDVRTLRYGWPDATEYRCRTAAEVAGVLRGRGWTGTLRRCGPACTATGPAKTGQQKTG